MAGVCDSLSPLLRDRRVTLHNKIAPASLPSIEGDAARVHQILTNLVGNAIKFTHQGVITVSASLLHDTAQVLVEVADTGATAVRRLRFTFAAMARSGSWAGQ